MIERVENYFEKMLSPDERAQFETDLQSDPELADAVAFYLKSREVAVGEARTIKLAERHAEWQTLKKEDQLFRSVRIWYAVAAAVALVAFGLAWYWLTPRSQNMQEMARAYAKENFNTLGIQMGGGTDSLQLAIGNYNKGKYAIAGMICKEILDRDPENGEAKKIAGIVSLQVKDYDKAVTYFHQLGMQQNLYANPGKFYEAIALLMRGLPLDKKKAENLLQEVVNGNLEGKGEAGMLLK